MYGRFFERRAKKAFLDTPVVLIVGPRCVGKTTLVCVPRRADHTYLTRSQDKG